MGQYLEGYRSPVQQLVHRGWCWVDRKEGLLTGGDRRQAAVELKGRQPWEMEGELQLQPGLHLTLRQHMFTPLKVHTLKVCG